MQKSRIRLKDIKLGSFGFVFRTLQCKIGFVGSRMPFLGNHLTAKDAKSAKEEKDSSLKTVAVFSSRFFATFPVDFFECKG